ncbi:MAG: hypothetical protein ACI8PV_001571 [Dinoroseobacter sp.]|jgi:hypothetical protein
MTTTACPNCNTPVTSQYCSNCGQIQKDIRRFFLALVNEALDDVFSLHSRMWKTLVAILFRPGFLTNEYLKGRRVSYVQPVRLYFITSISFFLMLSTVNFFSQPLAINAASLEAQSETIEQGDQTIEPKQGLKVDLPPGETPIEGDEKKDLEQTLAAIDKSFADGDFDLGINSVSEEKQTRVKALLQTQIKKAIVLANQGSGELVSKFLEIAPPIIFCLLPLFALLLKVLYVFRGVYYTEHFIYAVHNHCFVYLTLLFYTLAEISLRSFPEIAQGLTIVVTIWIPTYLWISMKRVYGQGKFFTTLKFIGLGISYGTLLGVGVVVTLLVGLATL